MKVRDAGGADVFAAGITADHHSAENGHVCLSADGRHVAWASSVPNAGETTSTIRVWNVATNAELLTVPSLGRAPALSPDGRLLAAIVPTGELVRRELNAEPFLGLAHLGGRLKVWDVRTKSEVSSAVELASFDGAVRFSPDGRSLAVAGSFPTPNGAGARWEVRVWDVGTWCERFAAYGHQGPDVFRMEVAWSPDSRRLIAAGASHDERGGCDVLDATTGQRIFGLRGSGRGAPRFAFTPDGRRIASLASDEPRRIGLKLWDAETGRELLRIKPDGFIPNAVTFRVNGNQILSSCIMQRPGLPWFTVWDATPLPEPKK